jgi:GNAT superfamily N-acetyltransferase
VRLELRPGRAGDVFRLQEIERAAAELFRGSGLIDIDAMAVAAIGDHSASIEQGLSFVAEVDGRIAGFAFGEMHFDDAYLRELDVDPAYRSAALQALMARFVEAAKAKGASGTCRRFARRRGTRRFMRDWGSAKRRMATICHG